jgi:hypothetical protein
LLLSVAFPLSSPPSPRSRGKRITLENIFTCVCHGRESRLRFVDTQFACVPALR